MGVKPRSFGKAAALEESFLVGWPITYSSPPAFMTDFGLFQQDSVLSPSSHRPVTLMVTLMTIIQDSNMAPVISPCVSQLALIWDLSILHTPYPADCAPSLSVILIGFTGFDLKTIKPSLTVKR